MQIIPTILTADKKRAKEKLEKFKGIFDWVQLDIIDGIFADNKTLLPSQFANLPFISFFNFDVHLMVDDPISFLAECQKIRTKRVTGQIERMSDQEGFVKAVRTMMNRVKVGLAVDLDTSLERLDSSLLPKLDVVLLMTVKAGWGGQRFQEQILQKAQKLTKIKKEENLDFKIAVDGGVRPKNVKKACNAGVEIFYVGSFLAENPKKRLEEFKKAAS